jgi:putative transcriptional regulator
MSSPRVRGRLLVATPGLREETFVRTVIFVIEHNADGAIGVVLNRPCSMAVEDALPRLGPLAPPDVLFVGGPVGDGALIALGTGPGVAVPPVGDDRGDTRDAADLEGAPGPTAVIPGVAVVPLGDDGEPCCDVDRVRLFVDYAGWEPGQLDAEIRGGSWFVCDALPGDAFTVQPEALWRQVLRRQRGKLAWFANAPLDPATN